MSSALAQMLAPPLFAAAGLLVLSGAGKLLAPGPATEAMATAGLAARRWWGRMLGGVEIAAGTAVLAHPGAGPAAALAALYAAFALFLVRLRRTGSASSCGCLGRKAVPPSSLHVTLDLVAACCGAVAAVVPPPGVVALAGAQPMGGAPFVAGTILLGAVAWLTASAAPAALASYGGRPAAGGTG